MFLAHIYTSVLLWWCLTWVSKPEWVLPYSHFVDSSAMYIALDPHLVLHLSTSWWPASQPVTFLICISRGGSWLRFKRAITHTEDKHDPTVVTTMIGWELSIFDSWIGWACHRPSKTVFSLETGVLLMSMYECAPPVRRCEKRKKLEYLNR